MGELGLLPKEFWELTPAEFHWMAEGYKRRRQTEANDLVTQAWYTAKLSRAQTIPSLDELLPREVHEQTEDEMWGQIKVLNAMFGGEVV